MGGVSCGDGVGGFPKGFPPIGKYQLTVAAQAGREAADERLGYSAGYRPPPLASLVLGWLVEGKDCGAEAVGPEADFRLKRWRREE